MNIPEIVTNLQNIIDALNQLNEDQLNPNIKSIEDDIQSLNALYQDIQHARCDFENAATVFAQASFHVIRRANHIFHNKYEAQTPESEHAMEIVKNHNVENDFKRAKVDITNITNHIKMVNPSSANLETKAIQNDLKVLIWLLENIQKNYFENNTTAIKSLFTEAVEEVSRRALNAFKGRTIPAKAAPIVAMETIRKYSKLNLITELTVKNILATSVFVDIENKNALGAHNYFFHTLQELLQQKNIEKFNETATSIFSELFSRYLYVEEQSGEIIGLSSKYRDDISNIADRERPSKPFEAYSFELAILWTAKLYRDISAEFPRELALVNIPKNLVDLAPAASTNIGFRTLDTKEIKRIIPSTIPQRSHKPNSPSEGPLKTAIQDLKKEIDNAEQPEARSVLADLPSKGIIKNYKTNVNNIPIATTGSVPTPPSIKPAKRRRTAPPKSNINTSITGLLLNKLTRGEEPSAEDMIALKQLRRAPRTNHPVDHSTQNLAFFDRSTSTHSQTTQTRDPKQEGKNNAPPTPVTPGHAGSS